MEKIELTKEELKYLRTVMQYQSAFSQNGVAYAIERKLDQLSKLNNK